MSGDIHIRKAGRSGRITLDRPQALNALTYEMCLQIDAALKAWAGDPDIAMLVIDAAGDKAFCAGGDITTLYRTGRAGDFEYGRRFWRDEYRMNARLFEFPKPVAVFMQGFVMGGGVGVAGHASHRVAGDSTRVAMPECGIGLIPDVGGTLLLARAPGRLGEYLGVTGARMGPGDAIHAGFADCYIPEAGWPALIARLEQTADWTLIDAAAQPAPESPLAADQAAIDRDFAGETLGDIVRALRAGGGALADRALGAIGRNAPLSMACTVELVHRARATDDIRAALGQEYRFTYRAMAQGEFLEGIRAAVIDKDRRPNWHHSDAEALPATTVSAMLLPLGAAALTFEEEQK